MCLSIGHRVVAVYIQQHISLHIMLHIHMRLQQNKGNARLESYIIMMKEDPILTHDINITASNRGRNLKKR